MERLGVVVGTGLLLRSFGVADAPRERDPRLGRRVPQLVDERVVEDEALASHHWPNLTADAALTPVAPPWQLLTLAMAFLAAWISCWEAAWPDVPVTAAVLQPISELLF